MSLYRDNRKIMENTGTYFLIFRRVLRSGKHPIGFPELVGSILYEYEPERSHMGLFRIHFHDFLPKSGILPYAQPVYLLCRYLLYKDHTASVLHYHNHNSQNPYHPSTTTCLFMGPHGASVGPRWGRINVIYSTSIPPFMT